MTKNNNKPLEAYHVDGTIVNGYTEIELELTDEEYEDALARAKALDMDFNEYCNYAVKELIKTLDREATMIKEINGEIEVVEPEND